MNSGGAFIVDKNELDRIFDSVFTRHDVYLRIDDVNQVVELKEYRDGTVILGTTARILATDSCLLLSRLGNELYCARIVPAFESDVVTVVENKFQYSFTLAGVQIIAAARKEERKSLATPVDGERKTIFITNLVSDSLLKDCFVHEKDRVEYFRDAIQDKLAGAYPYARVFFLHERFADERMKYFYRERKPLYIENLREAPKSDSEKTFLQFYKITIFQKDKNLNTRTTVSEVSVPLFFKGVYPVGYLQVNNTLPITQEEFVMIRKVGASASEALSGSKIIKSAEDRLVVVDVSAGGLGVVFKDKTLLKFFKDGNYLFFNLLLPEGRSAAMFVVVRNINVMRTNVIRIGCQIVEIDALGQAHYEEFLETMK